MLDAFGMHTDSKTDMTWRLVSWTSKIIACACGKFIHVCSHRHPRFGLLSFANDQLDECLTRVWTAESLLLEDAPWVGQKMLLGMVYLIAGAAEGTLGFGGALGLEG